MAWDISQEKFLVPIENLCFFTLPLAFIKLIHLRSNIELHLILNIKEYTYSVLLLLNVTFIFLTQFINHFY